MGLVNVVIVFEAHVLPVLHAVGQSPWFCQFAHDVRYFFANIRIILQNSEIMHEVLAISGRISVKKSRDVRLWRLY